MIKTRVKQAVSPLATALTGAILGGAIGSGAALWNKDENLNKPLIGILLGSIPGLAQAVQQYARSYDDINTNINVLDPLLLDPAVLKDKSPKFKRRINALIEQYR